MYSLINIPHVSELPELSVAFLVVALLLGLLAWILLNIPFFKVSSEEDTTKEIQRRLDTFKKETSKKNARALLRSLPRTVYQFVWYDGTAYSFSGTGQVSVSRLSSGNLSWTIQDVEEHLKARAKEKLKKEKLNQPA